MGSGNCLCVFDLSWLKVPLKSKWKVGILFIYPCTAHLTFSVYKYFFYTDSPVAVLSVHANTTVEARIFGIYAAGLVGLLSTWAGAHSCRLHCHRYKTHCPTIHHRGRVPHIQNVAAPAGPDTLGSWALVDPDLEYVNLQEGLELDKDKRGQRKQALARKLDGNK